MKPTVLVVDDSLTIRMDLKEAFEAAGFDVEECASVSAARRALTERAFDVVLLDVLLPDGDGVDLLREVRGDARTASVPIMLLSSEAEVRDRVRGLRTGADEYVGKPYDRGYVVDRARELVRRRPGPAPAAGRTTTVLVVEDSATFGEALGEALAAVGYSVLLAATGEEGLRIAVGAQPDAVILDGLLPGIDGATVVRRLRLDAALRHVPCLLLTGSEQAGGELRALDAGADAYVRKDEGIDVVLTRLHALLRTAAPSAAGIMPPSLFGPKRILVVDDSSTYLGELTDQLRQDGYEVVAARSGEEALDLLGVQLVDCVLMDIVMPGLSGRDTCQRIKSVPEWRDVPILLITAHDDHQALIDGINAGADDYVSKSADFDVLKARVRAQLRRRQFEDENRQIREELLRKELEAAQARAAHELAAVLERKNLELEEQNRRVEEATRLKSQFLANMSHELRTPLNAIIGFSELMHDGKTGAITAEQQEFLSDVLSSARHLLRLIDEVLDLSKVESGKMLFRPERIDLADLVLEVHHILQTLAAKKRIRIDTELDPALTSVVLDQGRLRQVLYNYLSNALKATPEDGRVVVRTRAEGDEAFRLEVEDTGVGIEPGDLERLFVEFEQVDASAVKRREGTGLGLALTKKLVTAQGGRVEVRSTPGVGSIFSVVLPRRFPPNGLVGAGGAAE